MVDPPQHDGTRGTYVLVAVAVAIVLVVVALHVAGVIGPGAHA